MLVGRHMPIGGMEANEGVTSVEQYSLRANESVFYPVMKKRLFTTTRINMAGKG